MTFRAKIFLSVLLPACVLVAVAVSGALVEITRAARRAAADEFDRARSAFQAVLRQRVEQMREQCGPFEGPRFQAIIGAAVQSRSAAELARQVDEQFVSLRVKPDFCSIRGLGGEILLRRSPFHACAAGCGHPREKWTEQAPDERTVMALAGIDGHPFIAFCVRHEEGDFVFGTRLGADLERLVREFQVDVVLLSGGQAVFSSIPGWTSAAGREGDISINGVPYLAAGAPLGSFDVVMLMLRRMTDVEAQRRRAWTAGGAGLALAGVAAALVSARVSRGISRPVESLVEAARRVEAGDYSAGVEVSGRDEMARLGQAFNEMTEGLRKRRDIMEKTLSPDVAEELMRNVELGGERLDATILFMDVRGFTTATEGVDPADVVPMINDMMDRLAGAVEMHGGNVNKYLGDGLMAMFGAPKPVEGHALRAALAGLEMQKRMAEWNAGRAAQGLPALQVGVGINTGTVLGGRVGSRTRLEYTLIGEEVNLASRICGKAAPGQVLITRATSRGFDGQVKLRELEPVVVKGLSYPIAIYEVLG